MPINQVIHKHAIQNNWEFLACLKKVITRKGKKSNIIVSRTMLCTQKKFNFATEFDLRLK